MNRLSMVAVVVACSLIAHGFGSLVFNTNFLNAILLGSFIFGYSRPVVQEKFGREFLIGSMIIVLGMSAGIVLSVLFRLNGLPAWLGASVGTMIGLFHFMSFNQKVREFVQQKKVACIVN